MTLDQMRKELNNNGWAVDYDKYGNLAGTYGKIHFLYGDDNGCGVIEKPNGTRKWYYDKTVKQFMAALKQVLSCNQYAAY